MFATLYSLSGLLNSSAEATASRQICWIFFFYFCLSIYLSFCWSVVSGCCVLVHVRSRNRSSFIYYQLVILFFCLTQCQHICLTFWFHLLHPCNGPGSHSECTAVWYNMYLYIYSEAGGCEGRNKCHKSSWTVKPAVAVDAAGVTCKPCLYLF